MPAQSEGRIQVDPRVRASLAEIERLNLMIESARQANDPAKMRAAIDELQNSVAAIRANLLAVPPPEQTSMTPSSAGAMDHSKMSMPGMAPPLESPPPPGKTKEMDHSKKSMPGMAPKSPPSGKTKEMDHSQMDMSGKDNSMKSMPGMNAPAKKAQPASASPEGKEIRHGSPQAKTKDPICFKEGDTQGAEKATYKGKTYYFCSRADREKFLADPDMYVKR
jgi:YHS domain-containing protein